MNYFITGLIIAVLIGLGFGYEALQNTITSQDKQIASLRSSIKNIQGDVLNLSNTIQTETTPQITWPSYTCAEEGTSGQLYCIAGQ